MTNSDPTKFVHQVNLKVRGNEIRTFQVSRVNVLVGPNGSGKSLFLRELARHLSKGASRVPTLFPRNDAFEPMLISSILLDVPQTLEDKRDWLGQVAYEISNHPDHYGFPMYFPPDRGTTASLRADNSPQSTSPEAFDLAKIGKGLTTQVSGQQRFKIVNGDKYTRDGFLPESCWSYVMWNDEMRADLQCYIEIDLGQLLYFDVATKPGNVTPRMAAEPIPEDEDELSVRRALVEFYEQTPCLADTSDGTQAYVSLMLAGFTGVARQLLIDEPEAFLHPPLARRIGQRLAALARERGHTVYAATHSAHFLMGCLDSGVDTAVLRLNHMDELADVRVLDPATLRTLYTDPLLRSSRVLEGLFNEGVIVCEGEADRAIYEEVDRRLREAGEDGCGSSLFISSQGKHSIHRIISPLRRLGIPAAAIVDLDILKDGGFKDLMDAAGFPPNASKDQGQTRKSLKDAIFQSEHETNWTAHLSPEHLGELEHLIENCARYGVFVVPHGRLESWFAYLGVSASKGRWVTAILDRLGFDPRDDNYVGPAQHDVWEFVRRVGQWISNPKRRGLSMDDGMSPLTVPEQQV